MLGVGRWAAVGGLLFSVAVALLVAHSSAAAEPAPAGGADQEANDGGYVVLYRASAVDRPNLATAKREDQLGFEADYRYAGAIKGFAADLSEKQLTELEDDPAVDVIDENLPVSATAWVPPAAGEPLPPTGVRRILATNGRQVREASSTNVAVLDTGIRLDHPDLNAVDGTDCVDSGTPAEDDHGHGTHVAGTIAAKNNGAGVVGVAPGTEVIAVKVLNWSGDGSLASIICGINWITNNAESANIGVANMSLGGPAPSLKSCSQTTDAMHKAICSSVRTSSIDYVVAAGNDSSGFDMQNVSIRPAVYPQVLTVTAMADSDGKPGGLGGPTDCGWDLADDQVASFTNFGWGDLSGAPARTVAAPGVCIESTWIGGPGEPDYKVLSGTSMAAPHVAGQVALCNGEVGHRPGRCAGRSSWATSRLIRNQSQNYTAGHLDYGYRRDPFHEPLWPRNYGPLTKTLPPRPPAPE